MTECIHGLEGEQCDVCFPQKKADKPAPARIATRTRNTTDVRPSRAAATRSFKPITEERVYYVAHVSTLPSLLERGAITADAPTLYSELGTELRTTAEVTHGRPVASYVSFSLTPDSASWLELRAGALGPGWSAQAQRSTPSDFVFLVTTIGALGPVTVTDGNAAGTLTRFMSETEDVRRAVARALADEDLRARVEVLVDGEVPLSSIPTIGVANEPTKERLRSMLSGSGLTPRIAVYPPWFQSE
ncbi:hypothetical protein M2152_001062 [Microbacteriaceae bacterium SG_E_30_P1]|uniref:DarT domain-containing protein n=1 Tax=Antiquaquibacter oligotrophicus TaxID=2880260 RepID=A0ABT6KMC5_9MICO|nr:DarT ssDNA thymidine ADP-ribosyltransferase family protein [Antiquaquibacter oligotrophicus]MDH6180880.1 hypothetical protein [Antiquaquibacter oligotrophicus]UDF13412.1 DUF4433 domain-containing protein [Antiquaquibacter oligotrophicus]